MKKLEDIPKKNIFEVPDGYFEKLPGVIQSRVTNRERKSMPAFNFALRFAVPVLVAMAIAAVFWLSRAETNANAQSILASVQTEDLVAYLSETDFTTDELLDYVELDGEDVSQIEESVYEFQLNDAGIEDFLNEIEQ